MKMLGVILACMMFMPIVGVAQDTTKVLVSKSMLTAEQLKNMQTQDMSPEAVSKWAGVGKEVGTAVNSALGAVTDQAGKFGETKIGKITIFLVVWKVIGRDLMGYIVGFFFLAIGLPTIIWSMKRYIARNRISGEEMNDKGKVIKRTYEQMRGDGEAVAWHWALMILLTLLCTVIFFT